MDLSFKRIYVHVMGSTARNIETIAREQAERQVSPQEREEYGIELPTTEEVLPADPLQQIREELSASRTV